jgi:di/tricarboxylate transporter
MQNKKLWAKIIISLAVLFLGILMTVPEVLSGLYWDCNRVKQGMSYVDTKQLLMNYQRSEYGFREFTKPDVSVDVRWIFAIPASYSCVIDFENDLVSDVDADLKLRGKLDF